MLSKQLFLASLFSLLSACGSSGALEQVPVKSTAYVVSGMEHYLVQYIWLDLPKQIEPGTQSVQVFMATTKPPKAMIPTMIDLACALASPTESVELEPVALPFEFDDTEQFKSTYTWVSCAKCDKQCYMPSEYTIYMTGAIRQEIVSIELALLHFVKSAPVPFLKVELYKSAQASMEPRMKCSRYECTGIYYVKAH